MCWCASGKYMSFIFGMSLFVVSLSWIKINYCFIFYDCQYSVFLVILLILEISAGMLLFVLRDKGWVRWMREYIKSWIQISFFSRCVCCSFQIKEQATDGLRAFITHYREDPDQQNLIDWIQEDWLQCCGINGPNDWDNNNYFNCSSLAVGSREACGVPFSCCKRQPNEIIRNKQCGYDVRRETNVRSYFYLEHFENVILTQFIF